MAILYQQFWEEGEGLNENMMFPKPETFRSKKYLKYIESLDCCVDHLCEGDVVAHHTECGGKALKGNDLLSIPLCHKHHDEHDRIGKVTFYEDNNIDKWEIIARCLADYIEKE